MFVYLNLCSATNNPKMTGNIPIQDLFKIIAYTKFDETLSYCSPVTEWKQNSDMNQGP